MATQTIEIRSEHADETNTVCRARNASTSALVQSSATLAAPDASGLRYFPAFTDLPAGEYLFVLESSAGDDLTYGWATVTLTTATFVLYGAPAAELPALATTIGTPAGASLAADVAAVKVDTTTLVSRVTTTVATLWANLTAMITGSLGTAAFSETALANAPAGGGGGGTATIENQLAMIDDLTAIKAKTQLLTSDTAVQYRSHVQVDGSLSLTIGDDYLGTTYRLTVPLTDADASWHTYLTDGVTAISFAARLRGKSTRITGTIDAENITHDSGVTNIVVTITQTQLGTVAGEYDYHIDATDADGNHNICKGCLQLHPDA